MSSRLISDLKIIVELFTFLYCLAELFGKKLKISIHAVVLIIVNLFIITGINDFKFPQYFRPLCYIAMFLYGLLYYGESVKLTLVNCFITAIIVALLPLSLYLPLYYLWFPKYGQADLYGLLADIGCIVLIIFCKHKIKLKSISDFCIKRSKLILIVTMLILCGLGYEFYRMIDTRLILNETYFQMVYFFLIFSFIIFEWQKSRMEVEKKKAQLEMNKLYSGAYDQLIRLVRERQHDMKNHINAILSMIYTAENFEELKAKQAEYCGYVIEQNEKTKLILSSGNPLIAGFLYSKMREAEKYDIAIDFKIGIGKLKLSFRNMN